MFGRSARGRALGVSLLVATAIVVAPARPALANGLCSPVNPPQIDQEIVCDGGGITTVPVPAGSQTVKLLVIGAGGGGVRTNQGWADGGDGAAIAGWATLPPGTTSLKVTVGAGSQPRVADPGVTLGAANGGGGSGVAAVRTGLPDLPLVIAGGGGGAGGSDRPGTASFGAGGDAAPPGNAPAGSGDESGVVDESAGGGGGAAGPTGGPGGTTVFNTVFSAPAEEQGQPGANASTTGVVAGGAGAAVGGGEGGGGYAGGGGGSGQQYGSSLVAGGGGGGSSFADPQLTFDTTPEAIASFGAGGPGMVAAGGNPGQVRITFLPPPTITAVNPAAGPVAGGTPVTISGTGLIGVATPEPAVTIGGQPCTSVTVPAPGQVDCVAPAGLAGAADVEVTARYGTATSSGAFTYAGPPQITSLDPERGRFQGGATLTVTGADLKSTSSVTIDGVPCPGTGPAGAYVTTTTSVTCTVPPAVHGAGGRDVVVTTLGGTDTEPNGFRYDGLPVIQSVAPTAGPLAGGNALTILGEELGTVGWVRVGGQLCASMAPTDAKVTCVVPPGATPGPVGVVASAAAGVDDLPNAYEYLPAPTIPPVPQPTTAPTPTTAPPTTAPPPTTPPTTPPAGEPTPAPKLSLSLAVRPGAAVAGAPASVSGDGLRPRSQYLVTMYSSPVRLASGHADEAGAFTARFTLPRRACVKGGLHRVVLSGFAPDGSVVSTTNWLLFDDSCTTRTTVSPAKPATVTYGTFRFGHGSARLTPYVKGVLRRTHGTLRSAKLVTITGYTQTGRRSEAAQRANKALALRRAQAARSYLRALGVTAPITVIGAGAVDPLRGRPQSWNRRVFIVARY